LSEKKRRKTGIKEQVKEKKNKNFNNIDFNILKIKDKE